MCGGGVPIALPAATASAGLILGDTVSGEPAGGISSAGKVSEECLSSSGAGEAQVAEKNIIEATMSEGSISEARLSKDTTSHEQLSEETAVGKKDLMPSLPLPHELVGAILSKLDDVYDLRRARVVCKDFAAAGLPFLSNGIVHLAPFKEEVDTIVHISEHAEGNKLIKKVYCYTPVIFGGHATHLLWDEWWSRSLGLDPLLHQQDTVNRMSAQHSIYHDLCWAQLYLNHSVEDNLTKAFERMTQIREIYIFDDHWASSRMMPLDTFHGDAGFMVNNVWTAWATPYLMWIWAIRAASRAKLKIRRLSVQHLGPYEFGLRTAHPLPLQGISHRIFHQASEEDWQHMVFIARNLTELQLMIDSHDKEPQWQESVDSPMGLPRFLASAESLRKLDLSTNLPLTRDSDKEGYASIDVGLLLPLSLIFMPNLTHLTLWTFTIQAPENLAKLLQHYSGQLKTVNFGRLLLLDTTWEDFLITLRQKAVRVIETFRLLVHAPLPAEHEEDEYRGRLVRVTGVKEYLDNGGDVPSMVREASSMEDADVDSDDDLAPTCQKDETRVYQSLYSSLATNRRLRQEFLEARWRTPSFGSLASTTSELETAEAAGANTSND